MEPQIKKGALVSALLGSSDLRRARWTYALALADSGSGARGGSPVVKLHANGRTFTRLVRHVEVISQ
jgi:hypothetical protein